MFVPLVFALSLPLLHTLVGAFAFAQLASGGLDELELVVVDGEFRYGLDNTDVACVVCSTQ